MANHRIWAPWRLEYVKDAGKDPEEECIFCAFPAQGAKHDEENLIVHRGQKNFVILNKFPYTNGHLMVAPFEHTSTLPELDAETLAEMMALAQQGMRRLESTYSPQGYNAGFNQGKVAGAGVEHHIHMHVVPRWGGDTNFMPVLADTRVMPQTLEQSYEALQAHLTDVPAQIFKAYDIRGLYGEEMDGDTAYLIGRAFARVLGELRGKPTSELEVGLGRDMRLTAPEMAGRLCDGLVDEGARVLDAGMVATEVLYYLVGCRELDGGAEVTASHNPKAYTGVKLVREGALALSGDAGIGDVRRLIEAGLPDPPGGGSVSTIDVLDGFHEKVLGFIDPTQVKTMNVVADGGNGMAGPTVGPLLRRLGLDLEELYFTPDGELPDHEPNPLLEENRKLVIEHVLAAGADLGIAWDGDADRCFFIDDGGTFVDGDFLTALMAESLVRKNGGGHVLYDVRASRAVRETVEAAGGTCDVNRVGHAYFKSRMRETGAIFGGEVSGHYYFRDFYCADSGTIPALLVLEMLSQREEPMSELIGRFRSRFFISGEINSEVGDQEAKIEEIAAQHAQAEISRLDGLSVDYPDWHFNVRPSNTEPLLRLNLESLVSREDMEAKRDEVLGLIRA